MAATKVVVKAAPMTAMTKVVVIVVGEDNVNVRVPATLSHSPI